MNVVKAKYTVIIKVGAEHFVKYHAVNNLIRLTSYLDSRFPDWKYFNVYDKKTRRQVANYTQKDRPTKPKV